MPKFEFPKFYIKHVGGKFSIEHRLTHTYLQSVDTEQELKSGIKKFNEMSDEEFWSYMIDNHVRVPNTKQASVNKDFEEREKWFKEAWCVYTDLFFTQNPKLLVIEEKIPFEVINRLKREQYAIDKERTQRVEEERREAERLYQEEVKEQKLKEKQKAKEEVAVGVLGNAVALDRQRKIEKKGKKKLRVKVKSGKSVVMIDSDDLFA